MAECSLGHGDRAYAYLRAAMPAAYNTRVRSASVSHMSRRKGRPRTRFFLPGRQYPHILVDLVQQPGFITVQPNPSWESSRSRMVYGWIPAFLPPGMDIPFTGSFGVVPLTSVFTIPIMRMQRGEAEVLNGEETFESAAHPPGWGTPTRWKSGWADQLRW